METKDLLELQEYEYTIFKEWIALKEQTLKQWEDILYFLNDWLWQ